jgi:type II secretory pathway component PulJ
MKKSLRRDSAKPEKRLRPVVGRAMRGVTLIELVVAMGMSALVVVAVFIGWREMGTRIAHGTRHGIVESEAARLGQTIFDELRRSPKVLAWDDHQVRFVHAIRSDTVTYLFDGRALLRNQKPVQLQPTGTTVTGFRLAKESGEIVVGVSQILLTFTLQVEGPRGYRVENSYRVTITEASQGVQTQSGGWNF